MTSDRPDIAYAVDRTLKTNNQSIIAVVWGGYVKAVSVNTPSLVSIL